VRRSLLHSIAALGVTVAGLLAASPAALAQFAPGWPVQAGPRAYASVGGGVSSFAADCGDSRECDRVGNTVRGALGVFLAPWYGGEIAAADFGNSRVGGARGEAEFGVRMAGIGVVFPVDYGPRFNGLLRLGLANVRTTLRTQAPGSPEQVSASSSLEGYYGFTMGIMVAPNLAIEFSLDGTRAYVGDVGGRVDALTVGLSLRF
jgi:hypothetical protein